MKNRLLALSFSLLFVVACAKTEAHEGGQVPLAMSNSSAELREPGGSTTMPAFPAASPENPVDAAISDRVREAILADRSLELDAGTVHIVTTAGVVTLNGSVRSEANKQRMGMVAGAVGSVIRVANRLKVDFTAPSPQETMETTVDRTISDRVRQAILMDRALAPEAASMRVVTKDGVVTLTGTVSSVAVQQRAGVVASAVGSVVRLINQLAVRSE